MKIPIKLQVEPTRPKTVVKNGMLKCGPSGHSSTPSVEK